MEVDHTNDLLSQYNGIMKENNEFYRVFVKKFGLSECSFWILYMLRTDYAAPVQSEICACLHQSKQTINSALKKLVEEEYLKLTPGKDRRSKQISLTENGNRLCEKTVDHVIKMEKNDSESLSMEEQELLLSLFRKYTDFLRGYL